MSELIKIDLNNCIKNRKFKIAFSIIFIASVLEFLGKGMEYFGKTSLDLIESNNLSIILSESNRGIILLIILAIPLIVCSIYSDSYLYESQRGIDNYYFIRVSRRKYFISKIIVIFIVSFLSILIPLGINEILTYIALPNIGVKTGYGLPIYEVINVNSNIFMDNLYRIHPYIYNVFIILLISLYGAMIAVIAFNLSLFIKMKASTLYIYIFLIVNIIQIIIPMQFTIELYIQTWPGEFKNFIITIFCWIMVVILTTIFGVRKVECR